MTLAGLIAITATLALALIMANARRRIAALYFFLALAHLATTAVFWRFSLSNPADAVAYFRKAAFEHDFGLSGAFITFLLHPMQEILGATLLDAFLVFQIPGLVGIILLHKAAMWLSEDEFGTRIAALAILLFLPGLHFWTSSIGKDSLALMAYGLIALGLARPRFSLGMLGAGFLIYFCVRPHVAFVVMLAMALAFLPVIGPSRRGAQTIGLGAAVAVALMLPFIISLIGLEAAGVEQVESFIAQRQSVNQSGGSSIDLAGQPPPLRVFTFLFRPLFVDASGALGLIVSLENLFLLGVFGLLAANASLVMRLVKTSEVLRFHAIFALIVTLVLSQTIANLGLAIRQKMMIMPAMILLITAVIAFRKRQRLDNCADASETGENTNSALANSQD